ncbi:hypothetical protein BDEG_21232 [Batrachochytrium dendrobatidis JEL423]|uniref:Uncharacterized protein n=1 Tax=Batrachochytrium dendrobatidis (strain JEL423) TaxID=403673 RepID=A0A177WAQ6_BATDL|nr:hypothetical protein BDEG_21232 [Batrachochytrium dendrobatidis JEL423]
MDPEVDMDLYASVFDAYHTETLNESNPSTPTHTTASIAASYLLDGGKSNTSISENLDSPVHGVYNGSPLAPKGMTKFAVRSNGQQSIVDSFSQDLESSFDQFSIGSYPITPQIPTQSPRATVKYEVDMNNDEVFVEDEEEYSDSDGYSSSRVSNNFLLTGMHASTSSFTSDYDAHPDESVDMQSTTPNMNHLSRFKLHSRTDSLQADPLLATTDSNSRPFNASSAATKNASLNPVGNAAQSNVSVSDRFSVPDDCAANSILALAATLSHLNNTFAHRAFDDNHAVSGFNATSRAADSNKNIVGGGSCNDVVEYNYGHQLSINPDTVYSTHSNHQHLLRNYMNTIHSPYPSPLVPDAHAELVYVDAANQPYNTPSNVNSPIDRQAILSNEHALPRGSSSITSRGVVLPPTHGLPSVPKPHSPPPPMPTLTSSQWNIKSGSGSGQQAAFLSSKNSCIPSSSIEKLPVLPPKDLVVSNDGMFTPCRDLAQSATLSSTDNDHSRASLFTTEESSLLDRIEMSSGGALSAIPFTTLPHLESPPVSPYASQSLSVTSEQKSDFTPSLHVYQQFKAQSRPNSLKSREDSSLDEDGVSTASSATAATRSNFTVRKYHLPTKSEYFGSMLLELDPTTKKALAEAPDDDGNKQYEYPDALANPKEKDSITASFLDTPIQSASESLLSDPLPIIGEDRQSSSEASSHYQQSPVLVNPFCPPILGDDGFLEAGNFSRDAYRDIIQAKIREQELSKNAEHSSVDGDRNAASHLSHFPIPSAANTPRIMMGEPPILSARVEQQSFDYASILAAAEAQIVLNQKSMLASDSNWKQIHPNTVTNHLTKRQSLLVLHIPSPPSVPPPDHLLSQQQQRERTQQQNRFNPAPFVPQRTHRTSQLSSLSNTPSNNSQPQASLFPHQKITKQQNQNAAKPSQQRPPTTQDLQAQSAQRLASLGIFDLEPKARRDVMPNPSDYSKLDLTSFETPNHSHAYNPHRVHSTRSHGKW